MLRLIHIPGERVSPSGRQSCRYPSFLQKRGVTSPIFGARTLEQLEDNLGAAELTLDEEARKRLEEVSKLDLVYPYDFHVRVRAMVGAQGLER